MGRYVNPLVPKKKERSPTYNMNNAEIESMSNAAVVQGIAAGIYICNATYAACMLMTLRDKLGFGPARLQRVFNWVQELFREKVDNRITDTDMLIALKDECGIDLIIDKPDGVKQSAIDLFQELETPAKMVMKINVK